MIVHLKFVVPSHPRFMTLVRDAVAGLSSTCGLPDKECRAIALAFDEALANVIRHAYGGETDKPIEVNCRAFADRLELTIMDQGNPPDPARLAGKLPDEEALGGRGMYLIRTIMDEVCYEHMSGGNQVRLSKRLPAAGTVVGEQGKDL